MGLYSDALNGYQEGANNALRVGAERLSIPTPAQSFLQALRERQQMGLQQQEVQGNLALRNALLGVNQDKANAMAQHYADLADAARAKQGLAEDKLKQALVLSSRRLDIQQQIANTNQATAEGRQKVLGLQAQLQDIDLQTRDALNDAKINFYNSGGMQRQAGAQKDVATTPTPGQINVNPEQAYKTMVDQQSKAAVLSGKPYTAPPFADFLKTLQSIPGVNLGAPTTPPAVPPAKGAAPGPQSALTGMDQNSLVPQDSNPLMALLKAPVRPNIPNRQVPFAPPAAANPAPVPEGNTPPPVNTTPNYPLSPEAPSSGFQAPVGDVTQTAAIDPLHGQQTFRPAGLYTLNGKQYSVDQNGIIQAMG